MTSYAAYLFDMDGLLLDTERLFMVPFVEMAVREGIQRGEAEAFYLRLIGTSSSVTSERLKVFLPAHLNATEFEQEWRERYEQLLEGGVPLRPHSRDVLSALKRNGARMAVVTSTHGASARKKLQQAELIDFFEVVKAGDEVSANKPDPAPYLEAAAALGVCASECVAFEDSDTGTTAAVRAGCHTFQIPDLRPVGQPFPELEQEIEQDLAKAALKLGVFDTALTS
ncbi:HAD family hydrolase [Cognatishimia activa]|uniref:Phosphorylated carbohydrates phosphatase n=1 Tax=Cognatishimia activa TaxID=1715691 RepID=A0A0P1IP78_9RHOB|nr:HAD family phosphatase [Cognatishimia activa]CUJ26313.1 Phosphorylated carbohydrates phosphatase [Cognatishimia activa]CUK25310.1 Phosphorylated carbohydrates phosphatase [Cognatishimia activa]